VRLTALRKRRVRSGRCAIVSSVAISEAEKILNPTWTNGSAMISSPAALAALLMY
jgi:hypothetical protein